MSLHYLIDGYNVIHQMPLLDHCKLEEQRLGLIQFIEQIRPQGSMKNKVTVVFDGQGGMLKTPLSQWVETIYSVNGSADEKIKDIVEQSVNAKNIVVVSDDRGIQIAVRKVGAKILVVKEFLSKGRGASRGKIIPTQKSRQAPRKNISHLDEFNINSEMSKIWLKKNSGQ